MEPIYLDNNATTKIDLMVVEEITDALKLAWGNPSSDHVHGNTAREKIKCARLQISRALGVEKLDDPRSITFVSGGTEALNWVIRSVLTHDSQAHCITSGIEHCAVSNCIKSLGSNEFSYSIVNPPPGKFHVNVNDVISQIKSQTKLLCVMAANNETGAIQPTNEIAIALRTINQGRKCPIKFLVDASQAFGKVPVNVSEIGCDYLVIAGHKFYGPRIGALWCKEPDQLRPMFYGGGQENKMRPGTENTPMIVGLGKAAELADQNLSFNAENMRKTRDALYLGLKNLIPLAWISEEPMLPNTLLIQVPNAKKLISTVKQEIIFSTGAACHSGKTGSAVLTSSGIPLEVQQNVIRFSTGKLTTIPDIEKAVSIIQRAL